MIYDSDVTDLKHLKDLTQIGLKQAEKLKSCETKDEKVSAVDGLADVLCDTECQDKKKSFSQLFQSLKRLYNYQCPFVRSSVCPSVCQSVTKTSKQHKINHFALPPPSIPHITSQTTSHTSSHTTSDIPSYTTSQDFSSGYFLIHVLKHQNLQH